MDEQLIQEIVQRAGISEESATQAMNAIIDYIKQHAPAPIASQLENYLTADTATSVVGAARGMLGGMFKKRDADEQER